MLMGDLYQYCTSSQSVYIIRYRVVVGILQYGSVWVSVRCSFLTGWANARASECGTGDRFGLSTLFSLVAIRDDI